MANNAFGTDLYRAVASNRGNFAYSPYALLTALSMARAGAGATGNTRTQLNTLLHAQSAPDLDTGINTLQQGLGARSAEKRSDTRIGKVSLEFPASLWGQRGTHFKEDYLDRLAGAYGSGFRVVDFRTDAEAARQAINLWGRDATKGRFEELVSRGGVTQYTRFLVAAESYMQAPWQFPFDPKNTKRAVFQRLDDQPADVYMMQLSLPAGIRYAEKADWSAVELPYLGEELSLMIMMPAQGQFDAFEQQLTLERLKEITTSLEPRAVDLRVPQFQFTTAAKLNDPLMQMAPAAFAQEADFSGITSDESLALSDVVYKGFYGINEEGTEAANTATAQPATSPPLAGARTVTIDRPFVFMVRDRESGLVLLIGRVVNPS